MQTIEQQRSQIYAEKSPENNVPQRYEVRPSILKTNVEEIVSVSNIQTTIEGGSSVSLPNGDTYRGQFHNKKYHGYGEYYFKAHDLIYKGEFRDGKQHGQGILYNPTSG